MSLRSKLTLTHTLVALLAIVVIAVLVNTAITAAFTRLALAQSKREAAQIAQPLGGLYERIGSWEGVRRRLEAGTGRGPHVEHRRYVIADVNGRVIYDSHGDLEGRPLTARHREVAAPVFADTREVGSVAVLPTGGVLGEREDQFLRTVNRLIFLTSLAAGLGAALIGFGLAQRLARPIKALTSAAHQLATGQRREPISLPIASKDEMGELTAAFNRMSAELAHQEELRRQLVADIAHELRTPLSVLRMELEALEDQVVQLTPEVLASLQEEVALLSRLVDDLRLLSLTEAGQLSLSLADVEPVPLLQRVAAAALSRARQQQVELTVTAQDLPAICADQQRLAQVLSNLVDNALRYTPSGGRITLGGSVRQTTAGDEVWLTVSDTGPGIKAEDLERIFERFYRTDRARARETGGSGLGLTIVKGLVEAMGGRVWAESQPGQGATFIIALRRAPAATPALPRS